MIKSQRRIHRLLWWLLAPALLLMILWMSTPPPPLAPPNANPAIVFGTSFDEARK